MNPLTYLSVFVAPPPPAPPTCAPCPACQTCPTTTPTPPELQCPVCTCTPVRFGSYGSLKPHPQSSYSCSRAHTPQITGIPFHYYGVLSCPTRCFAQCGSTYHCCTGTPTATTTTTRTPTASSPPATGNPPSTCFPSAATVILEDGQSVTMSDLQIGDKVQTGKYTMILSYFLTL